MDIDAAEMKADTIHTCFKKLISEERSHLAKEGKCFYCKKPGDTLEVALSAEHNTKNNL